MIPDLKYDEKGLIPAIIQDVENGDVLMMAYMNRRSLEMTIETKYTHFLVAFKTEVLEERRNFWKRSGGKGNFL